MIVIRSIRSGGAMTQSNETFMLTFRIKDGNGFRYKTFTGTDKKKLWRDFERDYAEAIPNVVKVKFESLDNPEAVSVGGYKISREIILAEKEKGER